MTGAKGDQDTGVSDKEAASPFPLNRIWVESFDEENPQAWTEKQVAHTADPEGNKQLMEPYVPEAQLTEARREARIEAFAELDRDSIAYRGGLEECLRKKMLKAAREKNGGKI